MRKVISVFVILCLAALVGLFGCSGGSENESNGTGGDTSSQGSESQSDKTEADQTKREVEEPYEVVMTYVTMGTTPVDIQMIEDAVNEISLEAINVKVSLMPVSIADRETTISLMISSGEKLDLMLSFAEGGVGNYVNSGQIIELDDLYTQYGSGIEEAEDIAIAGGYFDGKLYAIPTEEKMGRQYGMALRTDILEKYGFTKTDSVTYEDLDKLFAEVKVGEGNDFYMINNVGSGTALFQNTYLIDQLGADVASGVLMNGGLDSTEIVNVFDTEEYRTFISWMRRWYEAGYIPKDAATMTESTSDLVKTGNYLGGFGSTEADMEVLYSRDYGYDMTVVNMTDVSAMTHMYQITMWAIPITCEDPVAAFKFLDLTYKSKEIINLLLNGIEGIHYVKTQNEGIIAFPEGVDATTSTYYQALGIFGDKSLKYQWEPMEPSYFEDLNSFNESIDESAKSRALGYTFNSVAVKTEYAAVQDVISQYRAALETGSVDPDVVLPDFISGLEAAGIYTIIEENQRQLDEWLAVR